MIRHVDLEQKVTAGTILDYLYDFDPREDDFLPEEMLEAILAKEEAGKWRQSQG